MYKQILIVFLFFLNSIVIFSQANILNAKDPADIGVKDDMQIRQDEDKKLEYGYVDDRDILFSKVIWEVIDLNQRVNFPYLYPVDTTVVGKERRPLIHYLIQGLKSGKISRAYADGKFNNLLLWDNIKNGNGGSLFGGLEAKSFNKKSEKFFRKNGGNKEAYIQKMSISLGEEYSNYMDDLSILTDSLKVLQLDGNPEPLTRYNRIRDSILYENVPEDIYTIYKFNYGMIDHYKIKGIWYFDKRIAELKYRPLAIAPVSSQVVSMESDLEKKADIALGLVSGDEAKLSDPQVMFWIYYPDARDVLKDSYVFSDRNSVVRKSFDELINARRFHTMIYLEENMYEDREIGEYINDNAFQRLLESERIKEKIRNFEHDMWSW
tara:strand:- start:435 stop:1571 length:1137 start_codon:yes stop_codon:yes gene_type:complete